MTESKKGPTALIIFGVTGDLMARKIAPALFSLYQKGKLPKKFKVVGFARRELNDVLFRGHIQEILRSHIGLTGNKKILKNFLDSFSYIKSFFDDKEGYGRLASFLDGIDRKWGERANRLFYLAVPPEFYGLIFKNLAGSGLTRYDAGARNEARILVEKPFGKDLETAEELDRLLGELFNEEQIYRIDHYLAKEMAQNILTFRFANNLFQQNWSNETIEEIQIRLLEKAGVERRGNFYDGVGALRDVGQNHLLQVLALLTMEHPGGRFGDEAIRSKRAQILATLKPLSEKDAPRFTFRAQYRGYKKIKGVKPDSKTETYFKVKAFFEHPAWDGVPVYLEAGKRLKNQIKEAVVTFRHPTPCLCPAGVKEHLKNKVVISLEPQEGIKILFWSKKPGLRMELEERTFNFLLRRPAEKTQYIEEYEKLLLDCILGDQTLFVRTDEVKAMWRFTDPITHAWRKNKTPLRFYEPDTNRIIFTAKQALQKLGRSQGLRRKIGLIGLGKMGANLARRLKDKGWEVGVFNRTYQKAKELEDDGVVQAFQTIQGLIRSLSRPRVVWIMLTAGEAVEETVREVTRFLDKGDMVVDGGNSFYRDSARRAKFLEKKGIHFMDVGVSGGPRGAREGACLMIGGRREVFNKLEPLFYDIATQNGYQFFEGHGAGHFVKMVHNGIEYGMMQAMAEGFTILKKSKYKLDLTRAADVYNHGSVIQSRLMGWLKSGLQIYGEELKKVSGKVAHTGEGRWTVKTAKEMKLEAKIIEGALKFRVQSEKNPSYTGKILSALRNQFGGHSIG